MRLRRFGSRVLPFGGVVKEFQKVLDNNVVGSRNYLHLPTSTYLPTHGRNYYSEYYNNYFYD